MKKLLVFVFALLLSLTLFGCKPDSGTQGIDKDYIYVGNTAATSGAFAGVGVPFNLAMEVVFDKYNATHDGPDIKFIHYDDEFNGEKGLTLTKKLVEEDKVFALVGHFGTNTVNATMDYLLEKGIPMVYGVTGVNSLYFENVPGNNILSVQPIFRTEGRMMVARALHEKLFGPNGDAKLGESDKIVVLYSDDDAGQSIKLGIQDEVAAAGIAARVTYIPFSAATATAVVPVALGLNPSVILLSSNQAPATAAAKALRENNSTVPVLSSYVNGATVFTPAQLVVDKVAQPLPYPVYANAWVDISQVGAPAPTAAQIGGDGKLMGFDYDLALLAGFTAEYWEGFVHDLNSSTRSFETTQAKSLWANAYAMAGYVAGCTFVSILERVEDFDALTWESFIALAESAPIDIPMAGSIDWGKGARVGLDTLALTKFQLAASGWTFVKVREIESLAQVKAKK
ncbi:MAG TPA: ABC transporter substrate-binding protein [Bacilli bacterium]|nr:MAG: Receptor family ligand binding region [Tenericutes bacterium ADurb.BinA124]HNZ50666.1 ABC transporter substrate-binding protein [Bacilli bacterium]HPX84470.1 ABC transporter substrate-binding protein [Bacilli bacterium]